MAEFFGTSGDDKKLRGTSGDDIFYASEGDDELIGGGGYDVFVTGESIHDWTRREVNRGWDLGDFYGNYDPGAVDHGSNRLIDFEAVDFIEGRLVLGEEFVHQFEAPEVVHATYGETATYEVSLLDLDDSWDLAEESYSRSVAFLRPTGGINDWGGASSGTRGYAFTADGTYGHEDLTWLAEGETIEIVHSMRYETDTFGKAVQTITHDITIVLAGVNDLPTLAALPDMRSGGGLGWDRVNLADFGDDPDSDDDGTTLTYRIVSAPDWADLALLDATTLRLSHRGVDPLLERDEVMEGAVTIEAVDRHGAVTGQQSFAIQVYGQNRAIDRHISWRGVEYDELGLDPDSGPHLGQVYGTFADESLLPLFAFTEGDDAKVIRAQRLAWLSDDESIEDADGNVLLDDLTLRTGAGSDALVLNMTGGDYAGVELVDVEMGDGQDSLVVTAQAEQAVINGGRFDTGANADEIWMQVDGDSAMWMNPSIHTGGGRDIVHLRINDIDPSTPAWQVLGFVTARLGSGNDVLTMKASGSYAQMTAPFSVAMSAEDGDDFIFLANADLHLEIHPDLPRGGSWDELYEAGLQGSVSMGSGNDRLALDLSDAGPGGSEASLDGGAGYDVLELRHLGQGDFTVTGTADDFRLAYGDQVLDVTGFERIVLEGGADFIF